MSNPTSAPEISQEDAKELVRAGTNALSLLKALGCGDTFVAMTLSAAIAAATRAEGGGV